MGFFDKIKEGLRKTKESMIKKVESVINSFTKIDEVCKRAQMAVRKNLPFIFHWRGGYLTREVLMELVTALEKTAQKKGKHAAVSFNQTQAVLYARFPTELPHEEPVAENANEGEQD